MLEISFIIALTVLFLHVTTWEGMINEWIADACYDWPSYIKKPLYDCPICMSVWWGSFIIACFGLYTDYWPNLFVWILEVFMAGGINTVLIYIISADKQVTKESKEDDA